MRFCFSKSGSAILFALAMSCGGDPSSGHPGEMSKAPAMPPPPQSQPLPKGDPIPVGPITGMPMPGQTYDAKLLILSADGQEADLAAIRQALDYLGTPYKVWVAKENPGGLTASALASGMHGNYQGVIVTAADLPDGMTSQSALTAAEWTALYQYEATFGIRQVNWYSYPSPELGFDGTPQALDTTAKPVLVTATPAGKTIFADLNTANPLSIKNVWTYLAKPTANSMITPLLVDGMGNAIAIEQKYPDGRDFVTVTVDSDPNQVHTLAIQYGLINWVTKGVFIGERHAYIGVQIDDLLLASDHWGGKPPYRMSPADLDGALAWQSARQANPVTKSLTLNWAFNGAGAYETDPNDALANDLKRLRTSFYWISHTFTHPDSLSPMSYAAVKDELTKNIDFATQFQLQPFTPTSLVTPGVSGLDAADSMKAIYDVGVRYVVSDTSVPGQDNPSPNAGIYNSFQPSVLEIPRRATNLSYEILTPDEWTSWYNSVFHNDWGRDLTYNEIVDTESDWLLRYMLRWEIDPWMFHQENLGLYDGKHSLLTNLLDAALKKYTDISTTPLIALEMHQIGQRMEQRMKFNKSEVSGVITPGASLTLTVKNAATVPVTGGRMSETESYAGQTISYATVMPGQSVTVPLK